MREINPGTRVTLTPGTRVGLDSGEKFEWGGTKYDWAVVGEDTDGEVLVGCQYVVEAYCGPHATMNGGGFDWTLRCVDSGVRATVRATVRTTFNRGERETFEVQS